LTRAESVEDVPDSSDTASSVSRQVESDEGSVEIEDSADPMVVPIPAPRRSGRIRKPPDRFESADIFSQQASVQDNVLQQLQMLMQDTSISGSVRGEIALLMVQKLKS